ncbi:MAG: bifunctional DNA primase/polymerase [Bacillota bacterium]|nr:bifunctional DNA primase/polymerase [Bacillota bacterium]
MSVTQSGKSVNSPRLRAALNYLRRGWSVFPTRPGTKRPLGEWKRFQRERLSEEEARQIWQRVPGAGVAIVCGQASGGLVVLDVDRPEALPKDAVLPRTPTVRTNRGHHYYFHAPRAVPTRRLEFGEIRGEGSYVVSPPSHHPGGGHYSWVAGRSPADLPLAPLPRWLEELVRDGRPESRGPTRQGSPPGRPHAGGGGGEDLPSPGPRLDPQALLDRIPDPDLRNLIRDGPPDGRFPSRSEAAWYAFRSLVEMGWTDEEILALFLDPANRIGARYRQRGRQAAKLILAEIARARAKGPAGSKSHVAFPSTPPAPACSVKCDKENTGDEWRDEWRTEKPSPVCGATVRLFRRAREFLGKRLYCGRLTCPRCRQDWTGRILDQFSDKAPAAGETIYRFVAPANKLRTIERGLERAIAARGDRHGYIRVVRRGGVLVELLASVRYGYRGPGLVQEITVEAAEERLRGLLAEVEDKAQVRFSHTWAFTEEAGGGWQFVTDVTGVDVDVIEEATAYFLETARPDSDTLRAWPDAELAEAPEPEFEAVVEQWLTLLHRLEEGSKRRLAA